MDTKLATTNIRLSQWNAIIQDRIHSGLTVDESCEDKDITRNMYYYWLRKVKEAAIEACPETFAELCPTEIISDVESGSAFSPQMIIRANNLTIEVNGNTPQMVEYIMNVVYLLILYRIVREIK